MKRRKTKDNDRFASTENRDDLDVPDFEYREDLDPYTEDHTK
jgi:hypothetical protein